MAADADVLDAVVGAFGADADHRVTRLLIEALSPHGVIIRHMDRVGAVFQKWVASWVNRVDAAGKASSEMTIFHTKRDSENMALPANAAVLTRRSASFNGS